MRHPATAGARTLLLDSVSVIYAIEDDDRHGSSAARLLESIGRGDCPAVISVLALTEILVPAFAHAGDSVLPRGLERGLRSLANVRWIDMDATVCVEAARLRSRYRLNAPDAIHAATALVAGADRIVTNDRHFARLEAEGLDVWYFDDQVLSGEEE